MLGGRTEYRNINIKYKFLEINQQLCEEAIMLMLWGGNLANTRVKLDTLFLVKKIEKKDVL